MPERNCRSGYHLPARRATVPLSGRQFDKLKTIYARAKVF